MRQIFRALFFTFATLFLLFQHAAVALAHAEFRSSIPEQDAILALLPESVTLQFSEEVGALSLTWLLPDGSPAFAEATARSGMLQVTPPPYHGKGSYTLQWRVASADGHPVGGALVFSLGHPSKTRLATDAGWTSELAVALRAVMAAALALSVGSALFSRLIAEVPEPVAEYLRRAGYAVPAFGFLWGGAEGADRLGTFSALATSRGWLAGLTSPVAAAILLSVLAAVFAVQKTAPARGSAALAAWALAATSFAVSGHALSRPWPMMPLTLLHAGAALFWVGTLLPLLAAVCIRHSAERADLLRKFSKVALPVVVVLIATGTVLILLRAPSLAVISSPWTRLLAVKLAFVSLMLALAVLHRFHSTARIASGQVSTIRRSLSVEIGFGFLVLILAMGFRLAPPPAVASARLSMTHLFQDHMMVMITPSARPPGLVGFALLASDQTRPDFAPQEISIALSDPIAGIGPIKADAIHQTDGSWLVPEVTLPTPGPWHATVGVLVSDFELVKLVSMIEIAN